MSCLIWPTQCGEGEETPGNGFLKKSWRHFYDTIMNGCLFENKSCEPDNVNQKQKAEK